MKLLQIALALSTACLSLLPAAGGHAAPLLPTAESHISVATLSDRHTMLRFTADKKFLLIPVEEKEEISRITLLVDQQQVHSFNVKLAADRVDYYVPLDLSAYQGKAIILDVLTPDAQRSHGADRNLVRWNEFSQSDSFDTTNRETHRPIYHHTPPYGWMNDPNGMFYQDGRWHLYYQYNPYGSQWENMSWRHSTSTDLIHWQDEGVALFPDALGAIFSGCSVVDEHNTAGFGAGAIVAFYTSAGASQTQSLAYSLDNGQTFTKYEGNPVITSTVPDFRDPKVFWHEGTQRWLMVLAAGQEVQFFSSPNLKEWKFESAFGHGYGNHDGVWECPDMLQFGDQWVLILNINPGGPFGGSATQYFTGSFDGRSFTCTSKPETTKWMDYGKDHYATVSFSNAPDGRYVVMAWMSNWQYANQVPTHQFRSANSIPRDLGVFAYEGETYVSVLPSKEMLALRGQKLKTPTEACEILIDTKGITELTLSNAKGERVAMRYDAQQQTFTMDRTQSGETAFSQDFPVVTTAPTYGKIKQLRLFIDRCSIEVFDADGKMSMTNLVFPSEPYNQLQVKGGKATIYSLKP